MRPAGVRERIAQLKEEERQYAGARPEQALQRALTWFIHGCALLSYADLPTSAVVESFRSVLGCLDDPHQRRGTSRWEQAGVECIAQLRDPLAEVAADPQRHATRDDEIAGPPLLRIPPLVLVGRTTHHAFFPMACLNAAGSLQEEAIPPYLAVTMICSVGYFEPAEERDLLTETRSLRTRYEDQPSERSSLDDEIRRRLRTWEQAYRNDGSR
ncbi:hypothetical protein [Saccharopolyspora dendranthemae]|uniref:Uncharacterized protein n=1 Tax=Saccharopolyspora dendranthemae TaxID=1181886 RepID=A0A561U4N5_9PSEU|nr:hypothetical protein [Saccharopolyspora dendranthemae]TWF94324.1 hypothetical protein FHU35_1325 [Saccharopolyspora dendranthemae]